MVASTLRDAVVVGTVDVVGDVAVVVVCELAAVGAR